MKTLTYVNRACSFLRLCFVGSSIHSFGRERAGGQQAARERHSINSQANGRVLC
jgi:hypothetical protein